MFFLIRLADLKPYHLLHTSLDTSQKWCPFPSSGPANIKNGRHPSIDDYPNLPNGRQLHGCTNDVVLLSDLLSKRFEFAKDNISCLLNKEATRDGILKAFKDLIRVVQKDDVVVVHYSGHGSYIQDKTKGAGWTETIVPYDSGRKPSRRRSTDIMDLEISEHLLEPLILKTPFVTLLFDSCHSGSILRDEFGTAVRGIDPDGTLRRGREIERAQTSGWVVPALRDRAHERYTLLAACRADEQASETYIDETPYGAFTYHLCNLIEESRSERICALFQAASAHVTARYPNQHPILEGARNALIFGTDHLKTPRYLVIRRIYKESGTTMVEMDGGLVSGVTQGSTWAVRPVGAPPKVSDTLIRVKQVLPFVSHAKVTSTRAGDIKAEFGCFEISHVYGDAALSIFLNNKDPRCEGFLSQLRDRNASGTLNMVREVSKSDVRVVFLRKRSTVAGGDFVPQLGPLEAETCVALSPDGRLLLPPTTDLSGLCENLRKLARYRFGLGLRNLDEDNELRNKVTLELKWRPGGSTRNHPWSPVRMGEDGFPHFQTDDQIACVVRNNSNVKVWPYVLEFAEDGSVTQRYPGTGGEEGLAAESSTREVAKMKLGVSSKNAFQLAECGGLMSGGGRYRKRVTEVLKLFAATERIDLSLLLQTSFTPRDDACGLSSLLRKGDELNEDNVLAWETVNAPFVLEFNT